ncbi:helix-turn-helix domain-containing protein [Paenibacillus hemerocallicola]|uniref:Helix-turn-helix domain-containing protein n=1 Tax=Paenibacillus hemerocallicola TaxID=1172614 RepID=A0A5C4T616_9BACL|nr:helix-turn-helix domain-containing protein [Paenibacillus hemerocallicola]
MGGAPALSSTIHFALPDGLFVRIQAVAGHTFRVRAGYSPDFPEPPLVRYGFISESGGGAACEAEQLGHRVLLKTRQAMLDVDKLDGTLVLSRADGTLLTSSAAPPRCGTADGYEVGLRMTEEEKFYGLGDTVKDRTQLRGLRCDIRQLNDASRVPVPFLMSSRGWAILVNTTRPHTIDIGCSISDRLSFGGQESEYDYYLIAGEGCDTLLDRFTNLTGRPAVLPIWAYGLTFISNQYATARDVIEDGLNFRREGIPCDMIGLEPGWMGTMRDYSTGKTWHPERFAVPSWDPKGPRTFMGALQRMGFKLSLWLCCNYDAAFEEDRHIVATTGTRPEVGIRPETAMETEASSPPPGAEEIWYGHLEKFVEQGVSAFKLEGYAYENYPDKQWANGMSAEETHHLYHLLLCRQMHRGYSGQTGRRAMIYSMKGYTGVQKYAATWTGYQYVNLIELLNQNMSGNVNALTDMEVHAPAGIHFGFLQTLSQVNSWAYWQHPSLLDPGLLQMFRAYAKLRYRMIPYLYSAAHAAARTGMPVMRAMRLMFPDDPRSDGLLEQYMLGDALLVGLTENVYLPAGVWIDYWTGERHTGPQELACRVPSHAGGPLFIRAGAIIPVWPEMSHLGQGSPELIGLQVYPQGSNEYTLYEDDGITYDYLEHKVAVTKIGFRSEGSRLAIRIEPRCGQYAGMPEKRMYELSIHADAEPSELLLNGAPLALHPDDAGDSRMTDSWQFDRASSLIRLTVQEDPGKQHPVRIEVGYDSDDIGRPMAKRTAGLPPSPKASSTNKLIRQVIAQVDEGLDRELTLHLVAERLHVNSSHLSRLFKREMGIPFSAYVLDKKMERAKQMLLAEHKIGDVADSLGFTDSSHFIRVFRKYWGMTPGKLKAPGPAR